MIDNSMKQAILHIPHSSTHFPFMEGYVVSQEILNEELLKLTDWYTDDLFYTEHDIIIKANFSRLFCDPERFPDDKDEVMSQFGMGVLYEKSDAGKIIRTITPELRLKILNEYYWPHHNGFKDAVANQLEWHDKCLIIDCHSFPHIPLERSLDKTKNRPDFNIGTDSFHTDRKLIEASKDFFNEKGFTLGVDWPYKGTIVPLAYYQKNNKVQSIMLEINRKLYLNAPTNEKSDRYSEVKKLTGEFISEIKNWL